MRSGRSFPRRRLTSPPEVQPAASRDIPRLNIYLVQVLPEPTMRSADLPMRDANGG